MKKSSLITMRKSPLLAAMSLKDSNKREGSGATKELALALPLTSLIDAFCIIVIYLLIGTQSGGVETNVSAKINLPDAENGASVDKEIATLRIEKGHYFLDEKMISKNSLTEKLAELKAKSAQSVELMIQADTNMEYADLDPLLRAGSEAGIENLRFAVIPTR